MMATNRNQPLRLTMIVAASLVAARAQTVVIPPASDPGALQQRQMEEEQRRRQAEEDRNKELAPVDQKALEKPAPRPADNTVKFLVKEIVFGPSEILPAAELEKAAEPYKGKESTLADLQRLAAQINQLYHARNVVTAQALIPPQDVSGGTVRVRLVEGRVGKLRVEGNDTTRAGYIEGRMGLTHAQLVDLDRLEGSMVRFNRTNDVQLRAALKPGTEFATTDIEVVAQEPKRQDLRVMLDDLGNPSTGRTRLSLAYLNRSLFGFRDALSISDTEAQGQGSRAASYAFPVDPWGGRMEVGYNLDKTAIKNGALESLNITGESKSWTVSLHQPVLVLRRHELDVQASYQKRSSTNWIDSEFLSSTDTKGKAFGLTYQAFLGRNYWSASYTRSWVEAELVETQSLVVDRGSLHYEHDFGGGYSLAATFGWQTTSNESIPSSEQYFIGGDGSVQGYVVGALAGDKGRTLNLTFQHPLYVGQLGEQTLITTGVATFDYGVVYPFRPPASSLPDREHLASVGWGLNAAIGKRFTARLLFNYALTDVADDVKDRSIHFQLAAQVF